MALPVLTFHAVDDRDAVISCPPAVLADGLARLCARGWRSVPLAEAVACLREGRPLPARAFVLTFDDGYRSTYTEAWPVLARLGLTATVFLAVGAAPAEDGRLPDFEDRPMLSWAEVREMHRAGIEFGAHTCTHPDLTRLPEERIAAEMAASKARIEDALGAPVTSFAYPFGRYDARSHRLARRHFACACSDALGLVGAGSDLYALARVDAYYLRSARRLAFVAAPAFPWYVRARDVPRRVRRALAGRRDGQP